MAVRIHQANDQTSAEVMAAGLDVILGDPQVKMLRLAVEAGFFEGAIVDQCEVDGLGERQGLAPRRGDGCGPGFAGGSGCGGLDAGELVVVSCARPRAHALIAIPYRNACLPLRRKARFPGD